MTANDFVLDTKVVVTNDLHHLHGQKGVITSGGWTRMGDGSLRSIDHRDLDVDYGPDCEACDGNIEAAHVDGCGWVEAHRPQTEITLQLNDATMVRHTTDPDLSDLYDAGWVKVSTDALSSLVRLDYAEAAARFGATAGALLALTADAFPDVLREAFTAARKALDEFEAVQS